MKKSLAIIISVLLLIQPVLSASSPSEAVFTITKRMSSAAPGSIWPGFDPVDFTKQESGALGFSSDPNDPESGIFMRVTDEYYASHTLEENVAITVHEAFHGFQRSPHRPGGRWGYENAMLVFEYEAMSPRNNALFAIEARLLKQALFAADTEMVKASVREFLKVRRARQAELEARFTDFEKGAELNEGLAEYAGAAGVVQAIGTRASEGTAISFTVEDANGYMTQKYSRLDRINREGNNVRLKFYLTGSAQAFILDRLLPGKWKEKVQFEGASLQDLLAAAVEPISSILERFDYASLLREEVGAADVRTAENRKLVEETLSAPGIRLTLDFRGVREVNNIRQFDPMNVRMIEEGVRLHTRMVNFGRDETFEADFTRPVLEDLNLRNYVSVIQETAVVIADGVKIDPKRPLTLQFKDQLSVTAEGVKIRAARGSVKIGDGIRITIAK